eukprot:3096507-Rhodomonas_salina.6
MQLERDWQGPRLCRSARSAGCGDHFGRLQLAAGRTAGAERVWHDGQEPLRNLLLHVRTP